MDDQTMLSFLFPPGMSDEAAYEISEFLAALCLAFEQHYFGQIRRHLQELNPKPSALSDHPWEDDPF
jgi:hypothetical protein